eukprot:5104791-Pyramimonas_sp.AAC.1
MSRRLIASLILCASGLFGWAMHAETALTIAGSFMCAETLASQSVSTKGRFHPANHSCASVGRSTSRREKAAS